MKISIPCEVEVDDAAVNAVAEMLLRVHPSLFEEQRNGLNRTLAEKVAATAVAAYEIHVGEIIDE